MLGFLRLGSRINNTASYDHCLVKAATEVNLVIKPCEGSDMDGIDIMNYCGLEAPSEDEFDAVLAEVRALRVVGGYWHAEIEGDFAIVASEESNNEAGEVELLERVASVHGEQESFSHECP
jgi:hypothetical protein